jgi:hypothetical protein
MHRYQLIDGTIVEVWRQSPHYNLRIRYRYPDGKVWTGDTSGEFVAKLRREADKLN